MAKMNEKYIEKKLRERVSDIGGLALKFTSAFYTGMPDRLVLMPGMKMYWVEVKSTGKKLSANQVASKRRLEVLGFEVYVIDDSEKLQDFLKLIAK